MVLYYDEAQLATQPTLRRSWRPRGQHRPLPHPGRQQHSSLHGAVRYPDGDCYFKVLPRVSSSCCIEFLRGLLENWPDQQVHVILDSASSHRSHATEKFVAAQERLHLHYQPTYAPWTNPVERVWQEMRRAVTHCHTFGTLSEVMAAALTWCQRFGNNRPAVRRLASFQGPNPAP